jgi:antitoxin HicB
MFEMRYPAEIAQHPEGKGWVVNEAADCLGSYLAMLIAHRKAIPEPSTAKGKRRLISVPLWIAPKLALYRALQEQGISNSELARRLGVSETIARRMLNPDHATKSARLEEALRAVGKRLLVAVDDAA